MVDDLRLRRWRDFLRRAEFSPASVYRHRCDGWPYIPIHPFADEAAELARVGMAPEDCGSADAWWGIEGDATLVESCITRLAHHPRGPVCPSNRARGGMGLPAGSARCPLRHTRGVRGRAVSVRLPGLPWRRAIPVASGFGARPAGRYPGLSRRSAGPGPLRRFPVRFSGVARRSGPRSHLVSRRERSRWRRTFQTGLSIPPRMSSPGSSRAVPSTSRRSRRRATPSS